MIIYDCEIKLAIPPRDGERLPDFDYCEGWRDFDNMGISVICAYDTITRRNRVFMDDNMDAFKALVDSADVLAGFNNHQFDDRLCAANGITIPHEKSYDLLAELWAGAGLAREYTGADHAGFGLNACAAVNFIDVKKGYGGTAPIDWQRGRYGALIDYCLHDVMLTCWLLDRVEVYGCIADPRGHRNVSFRGSIINCRRP